MRMRDALITSQLTAVILLAACASPAGDAAPGETLPTPVPSPATPAEIPAIPDEPTPVPNPAPSGIVDAFGVEMVLVPEGIFMMGSDDEAADAHERPAHSVYTDAVLIDIYEATNSLFQACVEAGACQQPALIPGYQENPDFADYPAVNVMWEMANDYCAWRGGRLPTEAEWEKAARWDPATNSARTYPWGDQPPDARFANTSGAGVRGTTQVGSYERGKSALGLYDMAGNVWEWVADSYAGTYYADSPSINPTGPEVDTGLHVLRGGSYGDDDFYARTTARVGVSAAWRGAAGVRCARKP